MRVVLIVLVLQTTDPKRAIEPEFKRPTALLRMEEARQSSLRSGRIEWSHLPEGDDALAMNFVSRYARSGDMIFENRGDNEGWTYFDDSTGSRKGVHKYPQLYMTNADGQWRRQETGITCSWWPTGTENVGGKLGARDFRGVGLSVASDSLEVGVGLQAVFNDVNHKIVRWEERQSGEIHEVTGHTSSGGRIRWFINAAKGWNPERVSFEAVDVNQEVVCTLREFDGVWIPETADYFMNGRLLESIQVRSAALNKLSDPNRFTLEHVGVEAGTSVVAQGGHEHSDSKKRLRWNGEQICSNEKWREDVKSGIRQYGPMLRRIIEGGERYSSPYETEEQIRQRELDRKMMVSRSQLTRDRGLWEEYVRKFIARYQLDEAQSAQAKKILEMCQKRADEIISKKKVEFLNAINELHAAKNANDAERTERLEKRIAELRTPIEEIFERELKPRLDSIPTRAQRKAAEQADDSQPAKSP